MPTLSTKQSYYGTIKAAVVTSATSGDMTLYSYTIPTASVVGFTTRIVSAAGEDFGYQTVNCTAYRPSASAALLVANSTGQSAGWDHGSVKIVASGAVAKVVVSASASDVLFSATTEIVELKL